MNCSTKSMAGLSFAICIVLTPGCMSGQQATQAKSRTLAVIINRVPLTQQQIAFLEQRLHMRVQEGSYWYDKVSGAWGLEGGPTVGLGVAGLNIGGPLRADASRGNTGVFINGRELHHMDVVGLQQLGPVFRGRYWVDAYGNCGLEGGPFLLNLVQVARAKRGTPDGSIVTEIGWLTSGGGQFKNPVGGGILTTP